MHVNPASVPHILYPRVSIISLVEIDLAPLELRLVPSPPHAVPLPGKLSISDIKRNVDNPSFIPHHSSTLFEPFFLPQGERFHDYNREL